MKTFREFVNEAKIKDKFELSDADVSKIKRVMTAMDEPMSPAIASSLKRDVAKLQKQYGLTFKEMHQLVNEANISEARVPWPKEIKKRAASQGDIRKGDNYTVVNTKTKEVLWHNLKRESANEVVEFLDNPDVISGSSSFIYDKYISQWN